MNKNYNEILEHILVDVKEEFNDEEIIHLLLEKQVSENTVHTKNVTLGQRLADKIATFVGSWTFIVIFLCTLIAWMVTNAVILAGNAFDPYPFILLNLVLSCVAAIQAPLIMMSQNRQEQKDRKRSENDYKVNLKTEIMLEDMHEKLDSLIANQMQIMERLEKLESGRGTEK